MSSSALLLCFMVLLGDFVIVVRHEQWHDTTCSGRIVILVIRSVNVLVRILFLTSGGADLPEEELASAGPASEEGAQGLQQLLLGPQRHRAAAPSRHVDGPDKEGEGGECWAHVISRGGYSTPSVCCLERLSSGRGFVDAGTTVHFSGLRGILPATAHPGGLC